MVYAHTETWNFAIFSRNFRLLHCSGEDDDVIDEQEGREYTILRPSSTIRFSLERAGTGLSAYYPKVINQIRAMQPGVSVVAEGNTVCG